MDGLETTQTGFNQLDEELIQKHNCKNRANTKKYFSFGFLASTIIFAIILIIVIFVYNNKLTESKSSAANSDCFSALTQSQYTCSEEHYNAIKIVRGIIYSKTLQNESLSNEDQQQISNVFNLFDKNSDQVWSYEEFISYRSCLSNRTSLFQRMDYNNDTILSFKEMVVFLMSIKGVTANIINMLFDNHVLNIYGYNVNANISQQIRTQIYYEYVADIYFYQYDKNNEGYITYSNFIIGSFNQSFQSFDSNNNKLITLEEYINEQFHDNNNNPSDVYQLISNNIINPPSDPSTLYSISNYDSLFIANIELNMCPVKNNDNALIVNNGNRRRLFSLDCLLDSGECALDTVDALGDCTGGEVLTDGLDTLICGGEIIECSHSCYEAYESC